MTSENNAGSPRFAICIDPGEYSVSLERWKVYALREDSEAESHGQLRVVDESGEDYLYPQSYFHPIELPASVAERYPTAHDASP